MAELASLVGATLHSVNLTAVAVVRGARLTLDASGTCAASAIGVRGDYVASSAGAASATIAAVPLQLGCIVPMLASEAIAVGDDVLSAASGKVSTTTGGGAVLLGKAVTAASGDGVLFEVLLGNPA
jgi:Uncharacterized conserved protein (DUF2190)